MARTPAFLGSIAPNLINTPVDVLTVMGRDAKLHRQFEVTRHPNHEEALGQLSIRGMSRKTYLAATEYLRNTDPFQVLVTLTFPIPILDDAPVKRLLDRLCTWLLRRITRLFWKREFGTNGRPHLHLLTDADVHRIDLAGKWTELLGCACAANVEVTRFPPSDYDNVAAYVVKRCDDPQNVVPPSYTASSRWWGVRGRAVDAPTTVFLGPRDLIAPLNRILRLLKTSKLRQKHGRSVSFRDSGHAGRRYFDCGGPAVTDALERYLRLIAPRVDVATVRKGRRHVRRITVGHLREEGHA